MHLKKHARSIDDYRLPIVMKILESFHQEVDKARSSGNLNEFRHNNEKYMCFTCICGQSFPNKKQNAIRHCKKSGCDVTKVQKESAIKLRCGRYVTPTQIETFLNEPPARITHQFDYNMARKILEPLLPEKEKRDHTYTHMYMPLILGCGNDGDAFLEKIRRDYEMIHSPPKPSEALLLLIHERAENWLLHYCQKNILMVPGNLRAGLQTFEGEEINEINQKTTYTMQHDPASLLSELKKLLSLSFRRGLFVARRGFDSKNDFEIADFLKDLLLEQPESVSSLPFSVEFCLMFPFRVRNDGKISMISCDSVC